MSFWSAMTGWFKGGYSTPHTARDIYDTDHTWDPALSSTDGGVLGARPYVEARIIDMVQRDGFLAGALETHVGAVVGSGLMLSHEPDYDALDQTEQWGEEFAEIIERRWRSYTQSGSNYTDAARKHNWATIQATAWRSFLIHGEILAVPKFKRGSHYGSSIMILDPNRLRNPKTSVSTKDRIKGGIKLSKHGEPLVYYIHNENPLDSSFRPSVGRHLYTEVAAYTRSGRRKVIHLFDTAGTEQTRGISPFASIIDSVKRNHDLSDATLKTAIFQNLISATITSALNYDEAMGVMGASRGGASQSSYLGGVEKYQQAHTDYYGAMGLKLDGAKINHLLPNEKLEFHQPAAVNGDYAEFSRAMSKEGAKGAHLSLETYTGDFSNLSFSGGQLSLGFIDRGHNGRRTRVMAPFCHAVFELFMEELFIREPELLPASVSFYDHRDALMRSRWMGPPPILSDPSKTAKASETRLVNGISTKEQEFSAIGLDWRTGLKQQKREQDLFDKLELRNPKLEEVVLKQASVEVDGNDTKAAPQESVGGK